MVMLMPGCGIAFLIGFLMTGSMKNGMGLPEWFCWFFVVVEVGALLYGAIRLFWWTFTNTENKERNY